MAWYNKGLSGDNVAQARGFFERALSADPDNVDALVGSARADTAAAVMLTTDPAAAFAAAEAKPPERCPGSRTMRAATLV